MIGLEGRGKDELATVLHGSDTQAVAMRLIGQLLLLRAIGMIHHGEPGYWAALQAHLERQRTHEAEVDARARMRKAIRLFEELIARSPAEP